MGSCCTRAFPFVSCQSISFFRRDAPFKTMRLVQEKNTTLFDQENWLFFQVKRMNDVSHIFSWNDRRSASSSRRIKTNEFTSKATWKKQQKANPKTHEMKDDDPMSFLECFWSLAPISIFTRDCIQSRSTQLLFQAKDHHEMNMEDNDNCQPLLPLIACHDYHVNSQERKA
jgi:hypothetical protein